MRLSLPIINDGFVDRTAISAKPGFGSVGKSRAAGSAVIGFLLEQRPLAHNSGLYIGEQSGFARPGGGWSKTKCMSAQAGGHFFGTKGLSGPAGTHSAISERIAAQA